MILDCNLCDNCTPKENTQTKSKENHMCSKYNKRVFHGVNTRTHNPRIIPCDECYVDLMKSNNDQW